jgi:hypothetical protein
MTAFHDAIVATAQRYALDAELLEAQVLVESSGRSDAFHYDLNFYERYVRNNPRALAARFGPLAACSYGLLQIELEVAYERGFMGLPHQLFDPGINLEFGARHLAYLLKLESGDYTKALEAYNAGPGNLAAGEIYAQKVFTEARVRG